MFQSNNYKIPIFLCLLLPIMHLLSCEKEETYNLVVEELHIDEALQPYFERFVVEGNLRGQTIDLVAKRIEGYIITISEDHVIGQCSHGNSATRTINIDSSFWRQASDLEKEFVVFHELGHCYLERSHEDAQLNRNCISMMHSGTSGCRFRYTSANRSVYLDELF